jgi:hypothetical protein
MSINEHRIAPGACARLSQTKILVREPEKCEATRGDNDGKDVPWRFTDNRESHAAEAKVAEEARAPGW